MSLIFNPTSYCGKLFISMTSAPNVLPDPEFLCQCLNASFEEMKQLADGEVEKVAAKQKVEAKPAKAAKKAAPARKARAPKAVVVETVESAGATGSSDTAS
ncbi:hypothetical protein D9M70_547730 [compost metagenome]